MSTETRIIAVEMAKELVHQAGGDPVAVYLAELGEGSRRTMLGALRRAAGLMTGGAVDDARRFPWHQLRVEHVAALRSKLAGELAPATANKVLAAVRGILRTCWRLGLMDADTYHRAADVPAVRGSRVQAGRALEQGELRRLFQACAAVPGPAGRRDAALLGLLYGMRRSEIVGLDLADYDADTGRLVVRAGKGNKGRTVFLSNGAKAAVDDWIAVRGREAGPLLLPVTKAGVVTLRRMTDQAVYERVRSMTKRAAIAQFTPHDLRRTFAGDMLDAGADVVLVQALMGHSSVATTAKYDRRPEHAKRRAAGLVTIPYVPA